MSAQNDRELFQQFSDKDGRICYVPVVSLRDQFAMAALTGIVAGVYTTEKSAANITDLADAAKKPIGAYIAGCAYDAADYMLFERAKSRTTEKENK